MTMSSFKLVSDSIGLQQKWPTLLKIDFSKRQLQHYC